MYMSFGGSWLAIASGRGMAVVTASVLLASLTTVSHAQRVEPPPLTPADPPITTGPPLVTESQPSVSPPLSEIQDPAAVSIHLGSGQVSKTVAGGQTIALPLGAGLTEVAVQFPRPVDGRASTVSLQQTTGGEGWSVLPRDPQSTDQVAFDLRGSEVADLLLDVQPPSGGGVRFGLRITPTTVITASDAGGTVQLDQGDQFSVELGDGYTWSVTVADESIVSQVDGQPGLYEARQPGSTQLLISGDPTCLRSHVGCLIPSRAFQISIVVV